MAPTLDREFAAYLLRCIDDPSQYGVHQLFNDWWRFAPEQVKAKYEADFEADPQQRAWVETKHYADPLDLDALAELAPGTLGHAYHRFIVDNGLEKNIAINYRGFHKFLEGQGILDGMPEKIRYAILRGFQIHDFQHVLTGYDSSPRSEIALQAFCLAQIRFPYFAMWMSVVATRMTYLDPAMIVPTMDAITEGWQLGRRVANLQFGEWEKQLDRSLAEIRRKHGIDPAGLRPLAA